MRRRALARRRFFVYILANKSRVIYTGVTSDLDRRVYEHKNHLLPGFTAKYLVGKLVYFEEYDEPDEAIAREKQIKGWVRRKKIALVESMNPEWKDLAANVATDSE